MFSRRKKIFSLAICLFFCVLFLTHPTLAQYGEDYAGNLELGSASPLDLAISIVNWVLGILALIALLIMLYGGFIWMFSQGQEERVEQAKKILRNGLIGLVIILASWGITYFILDTLRDITGADDSSVSYDGGSGPGSSTGDSCGFYVVETDPADGEEGSSLCQMITVDFNLDVYEDSVYSGSEFIAEYFTITNCGTDGDCSAGTTVSGEYDLTVGGDGIVFYPDEDYDASTVYKVELSDEIEGLDSDGVATSLCGDTDFEFTTGTDTDTIPPYVDVVSFTPVPTDAQEDVCLNTIIKASFSETIDTGRSHLTEDSLWLYFYDKDTGSYSADGSYSEPYNDLDLRGMGAMTRGTATNDTVYAYANDQLAENTGYGVSLFSGLSGDDFDSAIRDTCGNYLDGDYDGNDEEESPTDDFIESTSASDAQGGSDSWIYPWNFTTGTDPVCTPEIDSIDPETGYYYQAADGVTEVTITGQYLSQYTDIAFYSDVSAASSNCFDSSYTVSDVCLVSDSDTELVVRTPVGSRDGTITVEGGTTSTDTAFAEETGYDESEDEYDVLSPYISGLSPDSGPEGQGVTVYGQNFGTTEGQVYFGGILADFPCDDGWQNTYIIVQVPEGVSSLTDAEVQVVTSDAKYSNFYDFTYEEGEPGPTICSLSPDCSDDGADAVTFSGAGLSASEGDAYFYSEENESAKESSITSWDSTAESAVADGLNSDFRGVNGDYLGYLYNNGGTNPSNSLNFSIPCNTAPQVVEQSTCSVEDDIFPLPNPQSGEDETCANGLMIVAFDQAMDDSTFTTSNINLYECNNGYVDSDDVSYASDECSSVDLITSSSFIDESYSSSSYDAFRVYLNSLTLQDGYWYKAEVTTGVTNTSGVALSDNYTWHFRVKPTDSTCTADYVSLDPSYRDFNAFDDSFSSDQVSWEDFTATAYTADCQAISSSASFSLNDYDSDADSYSTTASEVVTFDSSLSSLDTSDSSSTGETNVYMMGDEETTNEGTVYLKAEVDGGANDVADITVDFGYCDSDGDCTTYCPGSTCDNDAHICRPVVDGVDPVDGGEGSCVTVSGCYFGNNANESTKLLFGSVESDFPSATGCSDPWDDTEITAKIPEIATLAEGTYLIDVTSAYGVTLETPDTSFEVNTTSRPCLCSVDPNHGEEGTEVVLYGEQFGSYTDLAEVSFFGIPSRQSATISDSANWTDEQITTTVPVDALSGLSSQDEDDDGVNDQGVYIVNSDGVDSNAKDFRVTCERDSDCDSGCCSEGECADITVCNACETLTDCTDAVEGCYGDCVSGQCEPYISSINPGSGDTGQPLTISGCYLGTDGTVDFDGIDADLLCSEEWTNYQIILQTPDSEDWTETDATTGEMTDDSALVTVNRDDGGTYTESNEVAFNYNNDCAGFDYPILCSLENISGDYPGESYGPYAQLVDAGGQNFAAISEEYCWCQNNEASENCKVTTTDGSSATCSDSTSCYLDEECTESRDTYDATSGGCACYNVDEEEVCRVSLTESSCDYTYDCFLDAACSTSSDTYYSVGGFYRWPGSGLLSDAAYDSAYIDTTELDVTVPASDTGITSGTAYAGVENENGDEQCYSNGLDYDIICNGCGDCPDDQYCDWSYGEGEYGRCTDSPRGYCQEDDTYGTDSCCGNTDCVVSEVEAGYCTCDYSASESCTVESGESECVTEEGNICNLTSECSADNDNLYTYETGVCTSRPTVTVTDPVHRDGGVCLNSTIEVTFSEKMKPIDTSLNEDLDSDGEYDYSSYFYLDAVTRSGAVSVLTEISTDDDQHFYLRPVDSSGEYIAFSPATTYRVSMVSETNDNYGIVSQISELAVSDDSSDNEATLLYVGTGIKAFSFRTASRSDACPIDEIVIEGQEDDFIDRDYTLTYSGEVQGLKAVAYSDEEDSCTCYDSASGETCEVTVSSGSRDCTLDSGGTCTLTDDCSEDYETYDDNQQALTSIDDFYSWTWSWSPEFDEDAATEATCTVVGVDKSGDDFEEDSNIQDVKAGVEDSYESGAGAITITATANADYGWTGYEEGTQEIVSFFCPEDYIWTYENTSYNFYLAYCQTDALTAAEVSTDDLLPELQGPAEPTVTGSLLLELLFTLNEDDNEDALGLRIYPNNIENTNSTVKDALSPDLWYQIFFEGESSEGDITVDDYEAVTSGRSTYVAAANQSSTGTLYPNIYLLSYNQDAQDETVEIVAQLLDHWLLTTNVDNGCGQDTSDKQQLVRDTKRLTDLGSLAYYLGNYYDSATDYPELDSGSYVQSYSTSKWPSWQSVLANDLGTTLETDPYNQFYDSDSETDPCSSPYESDTCWDDTNKDFYCAADTSAYLYLYGYSSGGYDLYGRFEYADDWATSSSLVDPCSTGMSGYSNNGCECFNYNFNYSDVDYADTIED